MVPDVDKDELPGLTSGNDSNDDNSDGDDDSVGNEEVSRPPNKLNPTMTGKSHGNKRDVGVNLPMVGRFISDYDRDNIDYQYACASYTIKQGVVHFNVDENAPCSR